MATPAAVRSYVFSVNNRIAYTSLSQVMGEYLYGIKNFLVATLGYAVKYSCNGTTGPSSAADHTDRWTSASAATTRAANTATAQSWIVLTDGDGVDFMLSYTGATDDVARYAYSIGALYTPAGTATFPATATDEHVVSSSASWIEPTASGDRVWHAMGTVDRKNWRVFLARGGKATGAYLGIETYLTALVAPAVATVNKIIVHQLPSNFSSSSLFSGQHVFTRLAMSSVGTNINCVFGAEIASPSVLTALDGANAELQGSAGPLVRPLSAWSTSTARGKLGTLIDWWQSLETRPDGALALDKRWIHLTGSTLSQTGVIWPWDGATEPQFT